MEREIATVCRKVARNIAEGNQGGVKVTADNLVDFLSRPRFSDDVAERTDRSGVATGLAWTPSGGVASSLGETPANTQSAIGYAVPAIVGMLAQKAQTTQGAADLFGLMQRGGFNGSESMGSLLNAGTSTADRVKTGMSLVSSLFGARRTNLADLMVSRTGVRSQSATSLLALIAPFVLQMVGREASAAGGFNASSIARLLGDQLGFVPECVAGRAGLGARPERCRRTGACL